MMNKGDLHQLAHEIQELLNKAQVSYRRFLLQIHIPKEYFDEIKEEFSDRATDFILSEGSDNWLITFHRPVEDQVDFDALRKLLKKE
jgi:hypothetical protein